MPARLRFFVSHSISASVLAVFFFGAGAISGANLSQAVVRQKVNIVTLAPTLTATPRPAAQGSVVQDQNVVRTGTASRAELEFTDQTLARMGANSIFSFDAQARVLTCNQGAVLFSKPANSGRIEVRSGAITAAITGSTGFVSNQPYAGKKRGAAAAKESTTILGMLEGRIKGSAGWRDAKGRQQTFHFALGPGEMLVAQPGSRPVVAQFDLPRFVRTSPMINGFKYQLYNIGLIRYALAEYQADERRGFIEPTNVMVSTQPTQLAWVAYNSPNRNSFDASVDQLRGTPATSGGFLPVGGTGIVRGQLVWLTSADLDLHLVLPDNQEVFFANPSVTFNNGRAAARLDHDNLGGTIDVPPNKRVENIAVNGVPSSGSYSFFVNSFTPSESGSDAFTLTVSGGGSTQTLTGSLSDGQNSGRVTVQLPGH